MQKAMRRAVGVGGAAAVAIAASLALAGVADAHVHNVSAKCVTSPDTKNGQSELVVTLTDYYDKPNSVVITRTPEGGKATTLYQSSDFTPQYVHTFYEDGTVGESYEVKVVANSSQYSFDSTVTTKPCPQPTTPTTVPPSTKPTVPSQPSTPSSSSSTPTTAPAVAPVANQTPPGGGLAYTGVSATLPLIIGGALIIIGAAALIGMRIMKRRRAES
jgi:hypothetical protein